MPGPCCDSCKDTCKGGQCQCGDSCKCGSDCKCCPKGGSAKQCACKSGGKCECPENSCSCH